MVLRAANQDQNDCRWQSYHNLLAVERSETDEERRNVSITNAVRKKGTVLKSVPFDLTARYGERYRHSSSAPFGLPPSPEGKALLRQIPTCRLLRYVDKHLENYTL